MTSLVRMMDPNLVGTAGPKTAPPAVMPNPNMGATGGVMPAPAGMAVPQSLQLHVRATTQSSGHAFVNFVTNFGG